MPGVSAQGVTRAVRIAETRKRLSDVAFRLGDISDDDLSFIRQLSRATMRADDALVRLHAIRCLMVRNKRDAESKRRLGSNVELLSPRQLLREIEAILERKP